MVGKIRKIKLYIRYCLNNNNFNLYNAEKKRLIENFISLFLLQILGYLLPLITLPYMSKVLGAEKCGTIAFSIAVIGYFQTIVDYGFNYTAVRDLVKVRDDVSKVSKIFTVVSCTKLILAILCLVILMILTYTIPLFINNRKILLLTFMYIPCSVLFPEWLFQALEKMKNIAIMNVIAKIIFTILLFYVIKEKADYIYYPILTAIGFQVSGIIALYFIFGHYKIKIVQPTYNEIVSTLKNGWPMFLNVFFPNLYSNLTMILLSGVSGAKATGIFDAGNRFIGIAQQTTNVLSRTFYPFLARRIDKHEYYKKISLIVCIIVCIVLFSLSNVIISTFFTKEFADATNVLKILVISIIFLFFWNVYGTNYLVLINKEDVLRKIVIYSSICGFFISWILVVKYSYIGAAIAILIARALAGIFIWKNATKYKKQQHI